MAAERFWKLELHHASFIGIIENAAEYSAQAAQVQERLNTIAARWSCCAVVG